MSQSPFGGPVTKRNYKDLNPDGKTVNMTVSIYPGDKELVDWLMEYLGSTKSDVVRSAIRALASNLQAIAEKQKRS